ncbi:MAG: hypothetical protein FWG30_00740 [Eubacteriaceae bacterium]|nr:hypothetical protein [Eubacteriaceae bacterium]
MKTIEKILILTAILLSTLVFAIQIFYEAGVLQPASFEQQNLSYAKSTLYKKPESIALKISNPKAVVLINGEPIEPSLNSSGYEEFEVYDRDVVEIDLRKTGSKEVSIFVASTSSGIIYPKAGTKIFEANGIRHLFKIEAQSLPE